MQIGTDPRGPYRTIISVDVKSNGNYLKFECGHVGHQNPHFAPPKPGERDRCVQCGPRANTTGNR